VFRARFLRLLMIVSPWPCWPSKIMKTRGDSRLRTELRQNFSRRARWQVARALAMLMP
jgi:hypothetical protein